MAEREFVPEVWTVPILKYAVGTSVSWEMLNLGTRRGHSEHEQTDKEWRQFQAERKRRYREWRKLTDELLKDKVLTYDACYECGGELIADTDRPTKWVWDETAEEHKARIEGVS